MILLNQRYVKEIGWAFRIKSENEMLGMVVIMPAKKSLNTQQPY